MLVLWMLFGERAGVSPAGIGGVIPGDKYLLLRDLRVLFALLFLIVWVSLSFRNALSLTLVLVLLGDGLCTGVLR